MIETQLDKEVKVAAKPAEKDGLSQLLGSEKPTTSKAKDYAADYQEYLQ
jgi:hypothetical protein